MPGTSQQESPTCMARRRYIDNSTKRLLVRLRYKLRTDQVTSLLGVSARTVQRVVKLFNLTGDVVRIPVMGGRPRDLTSLQVAFLEGCVLRQPDIMIFELQELLFRVYSVQTSTTTIVRSLHRRGLTYKKISRHAMQRDEADRTQFQFIVGMFYRADQFVCVDESACDRRTTRRRYAWSYVGSRALVRDSFSRGGKYSIAPALSLDGILHCVIHEGSFTSARFNDFIAGLLHEMNPFPGKNSVILMDNASIHKSAELREMVESR
ncbi:unnamed protein product [Rhizoctonia solani]|uniref:Tc1-like transposase DDE domain-containing protein n=1 Tax=Rhizoctonia solani TaxID=456999 RepID=A0A8H3B585_9AGAM|nr:unnamed protein product [Rhizoctonia solani]